MSPCCPRRVPRAGRAATCPNGWMTPPLPMVRSASAWRMAQLPNFRKTRWLPTLSPRTARPKQASTTSRWATGTAQSRSTRAPTTADHLSRTGSNMTDRARRCLSASPSKARYRKSSGCALAAFSGNRSICTCSMEMTRCRRSQRCCQPPPTGGRLWFAFMPAATPGLRGAPR